MIETAGRWIGRTDLCEGGSDDEGEEAADKPADGDLEPLPVAMAVGNEVMPPARMQMIENEIAKLEKPLIRRDNSWA